MTIGAIPTPRLPGSLAQRLGLAGAAWVALGLALAAGALAWQLGEAGGQIEVHLPWLGLGLAFAAASFGLRTLRWHRFARATGARPSPLTSLHTQLVGFSLTMTPGKVGELYKCYLMERRTGVPAARTAPAVLTEKIMDGLAFSSLALGAGLVLFGQAQGLPADARMALGLAACLGVLGLVSRRLRPDVAERWLERRLRPLPGTGRLVQHLGAALRGSADVFQGRLLASNFGLSLVARACDGLATACAAWGLGLELSPLGGVFVLNSSGVLGGASMLPGGIGVVEAGMSLLLVGLGVPAGAALMATLIARLLSFWIWVAIGFALLLRSSLEAQPLAAQRPDAGALPGRKGPPARNGSGPGSEGFPGRAGW